MLQQLVLFDHNLRRLVGDARVLFYHLSINNHYELME